MHISHVAVRPTERARKAGCPALTPELLAATGARYSRSGEGLKAILSKIDLGNERETLQELLATIRAADGEDEEVRLEAFAQLTEIAEAYRPGEFDQGVDSIFKMVDYGHASIADMADVAIFMDGVSLALIYWVWSQVPTASGQETSTRYVTFSADALPAPAELGIPANQHSAWQDGMRQAFHAYHQAYELWSEVFESYPDAARIPQELLRQAENGDRLAQKKVDRMKRNYAFDRARYFIPVACQNNFMLRMPARGWVELIQKLLSHPWPEARELGVNLQLELPLATPRLTKHAVSKDYWEAGLADEFFAFGEQANWHGLPATLMQSFSPPTMPPGYRLETMPFRTLRYVRDLAHHPHRYGWIGPSLRHTAVRFEITGIAMAELRDLNRHRTGDKYWDMEPCGFYCAAEQLPEPLRNGSFFETLTRLSEIGRQLSGRGHLQLQNHDTSFLYWTLLGTQYGFSHVTTADKFIYEIELRTGLGSHFRYAEHVRELAQLWYQQHPETRALILEGEAEPE